MRKLINMMAIASVLIFSSCSDMDLDEELYSSYSASNFYNDPAQLVTQAWSIYDFHHCFLGWFMFDLTEKQFKYFSKKGGNFSLYNILPSQWDMDQWNYFYVCIDRANVQIKYAPKVKLSQEIIDMYIADARFMRAWCYFNLVRLWGPVPLYTEPTEDTSPETLYKLPASIEEIYQEIIKDLKFASEKLPENSWPTNPKTNQGRACQPAAKSLLAEVYLTMAGKPLDKGQEYFQKAYDEAKGLIEEVDAGKYDLELLGDWKSIFDIDNEMNKEIVFSVKNTREDVSGSIMPHNSSPKNGGGIFTASTNNDGAYKNTYDVSFLELFETTDTRYTDGFIWEYTNDNGEFVQFDNDPTFPATSANNYNSTNGICMVKYQDRYATRNVVQGKDDIFIRYVEAYLMAAEAAVELDKLGDARKYVNVVRNRVNASEFTSNDQAELRQQIRNERFRELFGEFTTTHDIRRWGVAEEHFNHHPYKTKGDGASLIWDDKFYVWPYPEDEVSLNPNLSPNW